MAQPGAGAGAQYRWAGGGPGGEVQVYNVYTTHKA